MLNTRAPFPQVGSYALLEEPGQTLLVRIQHRDPANAGPGTAVVSFPGTFTASGTRTVPLDALANGDPLSDAERAEMAALEQALAGKAVNERSKRYRRYMALREQDVRSETLADKLRIVEAVQRRREREAA